MLYVASHLQAPRVACPATKPLSKKYPGQGRQSTAAFHWMPSTCCTVTPHTAATQAQSTKPCWLDWADALPARHLLGSSTVTSPDGTSQTSVSGNGQAAAVTPTGESVQASASTYHRPALLPSPSLCSRTIDSLHAHPEISSAPARIQKATAAASVQVAPLPPQSGGGPGDVSPNTNTSPDGSTQTSTSGNGQATAMSPTGTSAFGPTTPSDAPTAAVATPVTPLTPGPTPAATASDAASPATTTIMPSPTPSAAAPAAGFALSHYVLPVVSRNTFPAAFLHPYSCIGVNQVPIGWHNVPVCCRYSR